MTDFQEVIKKIQARGPEFTLTAIAQECGVGYSTIQMLKRIPGREPRYELGRKLIEMEERTRGHEA